MPGKSKARKIYKKKDRAFSGLIDQRDKNALGSARKLNERFPQGMIEYDRYGGEDAQKVRLGTVHDAFLCPAVAGH